jgi:hypothetical protein
MRAPKGTNALNFYWMPYDKILSSCGSHHGFPNDTKKQTFGRAPAKEHSSQFCCQMVQWLQIRIMKKYLTIGSYISVACHLGFPIHTKKDFTSTQKPTSDIL